MKAIGASASMCVCRLIGAACAVLFPLGAVALSAPGQESVTDSQGQQYRLIEANHFEMGARRPSDFRFDHSEYNPGDDDHPIHPVILSKPYYMATTEVTVGQFKTFVQETGYKTTAQQSGSGIVGWQLEDNDRGEVVSSFVCDSKFTWQSPGFPQEAPGGGSEF